MSSHDSIEETATKDSTARRLGMSISYPSDSTSRARNVYVVRSDEVWISGSSARRPTVHLAGNAFGTSRTNSDTSTGSFHSKNQ